MTPCPYLTNAVAALDDKHASPPEPFKWFSEKVDEAVALGGETAMGVLGKLIEDAAAEKLAGYGPPQQELASARRKWLELYDEFYRKDAA